MKKLPFILFFALLAISCDRSQEQTSAPAYIELSENSINFNCVGEEISLVLVHNYVWTLSMSADVAEWVSLDMGTSSGGTTSLALTATANESSEGRTGLITFSSRGMAQVLTITQDALSAEVSSSELDLGYAGGTDRLTFSTTFPDWEISVTSEEEEWISAAKEGTDGIAVTTLSNYTGKERTATITVTAGILTREVAVTQDFLVLEVSDSSLYFGSAGGTRSATVETNATEWSWSVAPEANWLVCEKSGEGLSVTLTPNMSETDGRTATITISVGDFSRDITVTQYATGSYADKQVVQLQEATVGTGVNIIIMGDGYIASDMSVGGGLYERDMTAAMEHFFSVYPYSHYRDYFNVWMIGAISNEPGASSINPRVNVDTVFECVLEGAGSTGIVCNDVTARNYVRLVTNIVGKPRSQMTVIMPINKNVYAGTCSMWLDGFSISMCPVGPTYRNIVAHEAGGHGFGKLLDEYRYYRAQYPAEELYSTKLWQARGQFLNVDFDSNIANTLWKGFAGNPDYPMVGTWEGAGLYDYGIWRSEYNSCMNDNVLYFNAQSRYVQIDRIHAWAGEEYSFEQFLEDDIIPPYPAAAKARGEGVLAPFVPLASPILLTNPSE